MEMSCIPPRHSPDASDFCVINYGLKNVDEMDDSDGKYPSDISAPDLLERMKKEYHLTLGDDEEPGRAPA